MADKKRRQNPLTRLEYKLANKRRKERMILTVVGVVLGVILVGLIAAIILINVMQDGGNTAKPLTYVDYCAESEEELAANGRVVAVCNGIEVPYEALRYHTMHQKYLMEQAHGKGIWDSAATAEPLRAELEAAVVKSLQNDYMILSACYKLGINVDQNKVVDMVNDMLTSLWKENEREFNAQTAEAQGYASAAEMYAAYLNDAYMSEEQLRTNYKIWECLPQLIFYAMEEFGHYKYTLSNIGEYVSYVMGQTAGEDNYVRVIHVLTQDQAKAQSICDALSAVATADRREEMMHEFISRNYYEGAETVTRDGFYFTRGEMQESYETTAFALQEGEVSQPVAVSGGWCVMMRLPLDEAYVIEHSATLLVNYQNTVMDQYVETFREDCAINYNDYGKSVDLVAMR